VLKQFLRELPTPLLTFDLFDQFMEIYNIENSEERCQKLVPLISKLPVANRETLRAILGLCASVVVHAPVNKMTASNLATVLGPNLINRKETNLSTMRIDLEQGNSVVQTMIEHYHSLFAMVEPNANVAINLVKSSQRQNQWALAKKPTASRVNVGAEQEQNASPAPSSEIVEVFAA